MNQFRCIKDGDIENFLHKDAIDFLKRGLCYTYLLVRRDLFSKGILRISAYFTLSHKIVFLDLDDDSKTTVETASKTAIARASGNKNCLEFPVILIGQLGKYFSSDYREEITAADILNCAFDIMCRINELIPCRTAFIECHNEEVHKKYIDYEFKNFQVVEDSNGRQMQQMYKRIQHPEYIEDNSNRISMDWFDKSETLFDIDLFSETDTNAFEETNLIPI